MNATFETIRQELKKYNAEDNDAPPKLVVAGKISFLDIAHKRKRDSQFIIGVKEFFESEKFFVEKMIDDLETRSGKRPLAFLYDEREAIETVIKDFEDYYNTTLSKDLFQKIELSIKEGNIQFYLIIVVQEIYYYEA
jgi:predicted DNA-binding protein